MTLQPPPAILGAVAIAADGGIQTALLQAGHSVFETEIVSVLHYGPDGVPQGPSQLVSQVADANVAANLTEQHPVIAPLQGGGFVTAWEVQPVLLFFPLSAPAPRKDASPSPPTTDAFTIGARLLDSSGQPTGDGFQLNRNGSLAANVSLAALASGGFVASWENRDTSADVNPTAIVFRLFDAAGQPQSGEIVATSDVPVRSIGLVSLPDGGFLVAWGKLETAGVYFQRYNAGGIAVGTPVQVLSFDSGAPVFISANSAGLVAVASMTSAPVIQPVSTIYLSLFDAAGNALAPPVKVVEPTMSSNPFLTGLALDLQGHALLTWNSVPKSGGEQAFAQVVDTSRPGSGSPAPVQLALPSGPLMAQTLVAGSDGTWTILGTTGGGNESLVHFRTSICSPDPNSACLSADRFRLDLTFHDPISGTVVAGHPMPLTADTTAFWFFDRSNPELIVKLLDGSALNGHHWVFYASLTDVEFDLTVSDSESGTQRRYHNPAGTLASAADTAAFVDLSPSPAGAAGASAAPSAAGLSSRAATPAQALPVERTARTGGVPLIWNTVAEKAVSGAAASTGGLPAQAAASASLVPVGAPLDACHAEAGNLCLTGSRFSATLSWTDPATGQVHPAQAVQLFPDAGSFWFFTPDAIEVQVKVLDGTALNGHFWVFYASLTDVEFDLTVTDNFPTFAGPSSRTYHHPAHSLASAGDVTAF